MIVVIEGRIERVSVVWVGTVGLKWLYSLIVILYALADATGSVPVMERPPMVSPTVPGVIVSVNQLAEIGLPLLSVTDAMVAEVGKFAGRPV